MSFECLVLFSGSCSRDGQVLLSNSFRTWAGLEISVSCLDNNWSLAWEEKCSTIHKTFNNTSGIVHAACSTNRTVKTINYPKEL